MKPVGFAGWLTILCSLLATAPVALAGDAGRGQLAFMKCRYCHQLGPGAKNTVGPVLNGIVGRPAAAAEGYIYSQAMRSSGKIWSEDELRAYIIKPASALPGTKMTYAGVRDADMADDIISYLRLYRADGSAAP